MKQARATRLFHVEQFGAWPADLVPLDEKGNPRLRDRHSVAICFTWNKIRVRKSPTKVRLRGSRTYMKQARATGRLFHVEQSSCGSSLFHVSTGASQANLRWGFPHSDFVPRETYCNRMPVPGTGITFFVQRDEVGGPGTELFHVEQSCGSSLFHVRVRALDALPSGSSSLARGSENHSPEGLVLRRIPVLKANRSWGNAWPCAIPRCRTRVAPLDRYPTFAISS